jgi:hypothetical protein
VLNNASWITPFAQGRDLHFQCDLLGRVNINKSFLKYDLEKNKELEDICTCSTKYFMVICSEEESLHPVFIWHSFALNS